jgi:hypothetical protein
VSGPLDFGDDRAGDEPPAPRRPEAPPPARPPGVSRYTWFIGVVAFLLVVLVTVNSVGGGGAAEPGGPAGGERLPPFAAPLANAAPRADGNEDANLLTKKACAVRGEGILNICEQVERGPVVLALLPTEAGRCRRETLEQFDRLAPRLREARFAVVGSRGERADLRGEHPYPVAWDRDGGLASAYGLVGCPQITFAERGGAVAETTRTPLTDDDLARRVQDLVR